MVHFDPNYMIALKKKMLLADNYSNTQTNGGSQREVNLEPQSMQSQLEQQDMLLLEVKICKTPGNQKGK